MFVLSILGILVVAAAVYGFIEWFNAYTQKTGRYRFFSAEHTIAYVGSYLLIFFGYTLMKKNWNDDPLNGWILLGIGVIILILTILNNFKKTNRSLAIKGTIAQVVLYLPITFVCLIIFLAAMAFFSQTRPVYNINSKD